MTPALLSDAMLMPVLNTALLREGVLTCGFSREILHNKILYYDFVMNKKTLGP